MFGIGWFEVVVVFLLALLVFGPKRLPEIGKALGRTLRLFKEATREVQESMSDVREEFKQEFDEVQKTGTEFKQHLLEDLSSGEPPDEPASLDESGDDRGDEDDPSSPPSPPADSQSPYAG